MFQAVLWSIVLATVAQANSRVHRNATCTLGFNLGLVSEGVRLMYPGVADSSVELRQVR